MRSRREHCCYQIWAAHIRWQGWAAGPNGGWNKPPTPLWPDQVGEMCIREIDGKAVQLGRGAAAKVWVELARS